VENNPDVQSAVYDIRYQLGDIACREGQTQKAIRIFSDLISDPSFKDKRLKGWCYYQRAKCYRMTGDTQRAEEDLKNASAVEDEELKENVDRAKNY
jgi:lipopolysaccharide biosynthesis regulator YciM